MWGESGKKRKRISPAEAVKKIQYYCAYQERSHREVRNKLFDYGLFESEVDEITSKLIADGFLNEERFAKAFAGGKFRIKKWGKIKIERELEMLGVSKRNIATGLKEIYEDDYRKALISLLEKKSTQLTDDEGYQLKDKLGRYVIAKGYEPAMVWEILKSWPN
ncbi:MAG: RecX family transcriptional regulator [Bacteroidetes bacterium]|nr:RecX family transcriptional regulator [Bacteroidota bacterium]